MQAEAPEVFGLSQTTRDTLDPDRVERPPVNSRLDIAPLRGF